MVGWVLVFVGIYEEGDRGAFMKEVAIGWDFSSAQPA